VPVVLLLLGVAAGAGAVTSTGHFPAIAVAKTITVGKTPAEIVYAANGDLYVVNQAGNSVSVIAGSTNTVVATVSVVKSPVNEVYDPTSKEVYVSNSTQVSVISTSTNKVVTTVKLVGNIGPAGFDPANGDLYYLSSSYPATNLLNKIDHSTHAVTKITVGSLPESAVYDNATRCMVTSNAGSNSLSVVNSTTNAVTTVSLPAGHEPVTMVYNSADKDLYVVDSGAYPVLSKTGNVSVLSSANKIVATVKVGTFPILATVDPKNHDVYVVNTGLSSGSKIATSSVSVISTANKVVTTVTIGKDGILPTYDPANGEIYVPCKYSNATYVINGSTNKLAHTLATKPYPLVAFYDPGPTDMLVIEDSNSTTKTKVVVISSTDTIVTTLTLGLGPLGGGAYDPGNRDVYGSNEGSNTVSVVH
jgi:YVTN family beta-propeller protein